MLETLHRWEAWLGQTSPRKPLQDIFADGLLWSHAGEDVLEQSRGSGGWGGGRAPMRLREAPKSFLVVSLELCLPREERRDSLSKLSPIFPSGVPLFPLLSFTCFRGAS